MKQIASRSYEQRIIKNSSKEDYQKHLISSASESLSSNFSIDMKQLEKLLKLPRPQKEQAIAAYFIKICHGIH